MADLTDFLLQHPQILSDYFVKTESSVFVALDKDFKISICNDYFKKLVNQGKDCAGAAIYAFLIQESHGILPLPESVHDLSSPLNFKTIDKATITMVCHIFKTNQDKYLIFGGKHKLTNDQILQKMTLLSNEITNINMDLHRKNRELAEAQSKIKTLSGIIPICMHCKGIRDDKGYWSQLEKFITDNSEAQFSHGICEKCLEEHYPDVTLNK